MVEQSSPTEYFSRMANLNNYPVQPSIPSSPRQYYGLVDEVTPPGTIPYDPNFKYVVLGVVAIVAIVAMYYWSKQK